MVELKGSLSGLGLSAIVQLIGELHHSGTLRLTRDNAAGVLAFDKGHLVAAECGTQHGLDALASIAIELIDADFTFVEVDPTLERTLDLGSADVKALLKRILSGDFAEAVAVATAADTADQNLDVTCPLLGFADERGRHYSRSTALHRCYASGAASLVSAQEQRELCLSGRFAACPRYRNAEHAQPAAATPQEESVPTAVLQPADQPQSTLPAGVVSRLAATAQMHLPAATPEPDAPDRNGHTVPTPASAAETPPRSPANEPEPQGRPRRGLVLIGGGAIAGLVIVALVFVVALPALSGSQPQKAPAAAAPAFDPLPTATRVLAPVAKPTTAAASKPTVGATATSAAASATATPASRAIVNVASARSVMDVRFASGPPARWLDNPPFAFWSDGAFRLQARQSARFVAAGVPIDQVLSDVIVSATFRKTGGPPGGGYGLIVRDQGPEPRDGLNQEANAYVLETGDLGEFGVWRRDGDHWVDMVPWTRTASIRGGGSPNDLVVRAIGDRLTFLVNGIQVASLQDGTYMAGGVGVFVGGDNNEVALDHFAVELPD